MPVKVSDVMTRRIIFGDLCSTAQEIADQMGKNGISSVVILNKNRIEGIITEHDIVKKVVASGFDPKSVKADQIMSKPVLTIRPDADIEAAARIMRDKRIKRLIAVQSGRAEGIITSYDIVSAEPVIRLQLEKDRP
jgi:CBS domain-containing protein